MIRKLTPVEINRVDALSMGPAENQTHMYYDWSADDWQWLTSENPEPRPTTSLWQKLKLWLESL
jgi:hypothetical protein